MDDANRLPDSLASPETPPHGEATAGDAVHDGATEKLGLASADSVTAIGPGNPAAPPPALEDEDRLRLSGKRIDVLSGYEIERELGRGGMGVVYLARERSLRRSVALKVLPRTTDPLAAARFLREGRAIAALDHPSIVPVYQYGEADGTYYIAMKLIDGRTLKDIVAKAPLAPKRAASIMEQIARALAYAHDRGVLHRDVKPANILVETGDRAFLVDFGLALMDTEATITRPSEVVGTPAYMAPEQSTGGTLTPRSDVYGVGATLYTLVTGRTPFDGTPMAVFAKLAREEPELPSRSCPGLPQALETIIVVSMMKDPRRRYPNALALADDLRRFVDGQSVEAKRPGVSYRAARFARLRARAIAAAAFAVVLAGLAYGYRTLAAWSDDTARRAQSDRELDARLLVAERQSQEARQCAASGAEGVAAIRSLEDRLVELRATRAADPRVRELEERAARLRGATVASRLKDAAAELGRGRLERSRRALEDARALDPASSEIQRIERLVNEGVLVRLNGLPGDATVQWLPLTETLGTPPGQDWVTRDGRSDDLVLRPGPVRLRVGVPGRLPILIDLQVVRGNAVDVAIPRAPRGSERLADMVFVPPGNYVLGGVGSGTRAHAVSVELKEGFAIDATEVTRRAFSAFVRARGYEEASFWSGEGWSWLKEREKNGVVRGPADVNLEDAAHENEPVTGVCLFEAEAFAAWSGKRLPSADEWEMAARGTLGCAYPWGGQDLLRTALASGHSGPLPVGTSRADRSPVGCLDMGGNVREWTRDRRDTPSEGEIGAVVKGAAFSDDDRTAAFCARGTTSTVCAPKLRATHLGFRCVRPLERQDYE